MDRNGSTLIKDELAELEAEIQELAGLPFDVRDLMQLGQVLFERMKLPEGRRGCNGTWEVGPMELLRLAEGGHRVASLVLKWQCMQIALTLLDAGNGEPWELVSFIRRFVDTHGDYEVIWRDGTTRWASEILSDLDDLRVRFIDR